MEIPNRMRSINVRMLIDNQPIVSTIDYMINEEGVTPVAIWVKTKKSESTFFYIYFNKRGFAFFEY